MACSLRTDAGYYFIDNHVRSPSSSGKSLPLHVFIRLIGAAISVHRPGYTSGYVMSDHEPARGIYSMDR